MLTSKTFIEIHPKEASSLSGNGNEARLREYTKSEASAAKHTKNLMISHAKYTCRIPRALAPGSRFLMTNASVPTDALKTVSARRRRPWPRRMTTSGSAQAELTFVSTVQDGLERSI